MLGEQLCGVATPSKPMSQIESVLELARKNRMLLFESLCALEEKLKPITGEECEGDNPPEKEKALTPLAEAIWSLGNGFYCANNCIRSLIARLEI